MAAACCSAVAATLALSIKSTSSISRCSYADTPTVTVLSITGLGCEGCVGGVERALTSVFGVESAKVDIKDKLAYVTGNAQLFELIAAFKKAGKQAELVGLAGRDGFVAMTALELKKALKNSGRRGIVLDIDEILSATNVAWFQRLEALFGNPDEIPIVVLIEQYRLAQNVPFWQSKEALAWMQSQRDDPKAQDGLPLVDGAVVGVHALKKRTAIVGYCTVRPDTVNSNTIAWLRERGFPDLPVVAKPASVPFADGNKWKGRVLNEMWPEVTGIVDDNPKVAQYAGQAYPGKILLFGHATCPEGVEHAAPCATWPDVVSRGGSVGK